MIIRQYYEKLGSFLFALAKADGQVQQGDDNGLMNEILEILEEHPGFEKNAEVQDLLLTKLCYYNTAKQMKSVSEITQEFFDFLENNHSHISDLSKNVGVRLIRKVTSSYKGTNKQEQKTIKTVMSILMKEPQEQSE